MDRKLRKPCAVRDAPQRASAFALAASVLLGRNWANDFEVSVSIQQNGLCRAEVLHTKAMRALPEGAERVAVL